MTDFDFDRLKAEFFEGVSNAADSVSTAARDVSADVKRYKRFAEIGRDLYVCGLVTSNGGNMSETNGKSIWISRTGAMLGRLTPNAVVETSWDTGSMDAQASMELLVHRAIYQSLAGIDGTPETKGDAAPDSGSCSAAIIHAHAEHTVARSLIEDEICPLDAEGILVLGERVPVVKVKQSIASQEVADAMAGLVAGGARIAVVAGHGPFAVASILEEAFMLISCLEHSSKILNLVKVNK